MLSQCISTPDRIEDNHSRFSEPRHDFMMAPAEVKLCSSMAEQLAEANVSSIVSHVICV